MKKQWWILLGVVAIVVAVLSFWQGEREWREKTRQEARKDWVELGSSGYFKTLSEYDADRFAKEKGKDGVPYGLWIPRRGEADGYAISAGGGRCAVYLRDPNDAKVLRAQALLDIPFATVHDRYVNTARVQDYVARLQFTPNPDLPHQHMAGANGQAEPPPR